ncbi:MAG TPA: hypothetical protein PLQ87_09615, partial [Phycisphaerae bacterium]|nr:hypothetical protein [Phycisphaerae bacterium]
DLAYRDEDGYYWYVGRKDDLIKSSGYRIGPFEIENVIMELPYVLECGVSGAPDELRGQVICPRCHGRGEYELHTGKCPHCKGGTIICPDCQGTGRAR